jgi:hypothetical protein
MRPLSVGGTISAESGALYSASATNCDPLQVLALHLLPIARVIKMIKSGLAATMAAT